MNHDVQLYLFTQQIINLINNSSLSIGEIKLLIDIFV